MAGRGAARSAGRSRPGAGGAAARPPPPPQPASVAWPAGGSWWCWLDGEGRCCKARQSPQGGRRRQAAGRWRKVGGGAGPARACLALCSLYRGAQRRGAGLPASGSARHKPHSLTLHAGRRRSLADPLNNFQTLGSDSTIRECGGIKRPVLATLAGPPCGHSGPSSGAETLAHLYMTHTDASRVTPQCRRRQASLPC